MFIKVPRTLDLGECTVDDLMFTFNMVNRVARKLQQPDRYVLEGIGLEGLRGYAGIAEVAHQCPMESEEDMLIRRFNLRGGNFRLEDTWKEEHKMPDAWYFGCIYARLVAYLVIGSEYSLENAIGSVIDSTFPEMLYDFTNMIYYTVPEELYGMFCDGCFDKVRK